MKPIIYTSRHSHHHDTGNGHPESIARIEALDSLFESPAFKDWPQKTGQAATQDQIQLAHNADYIYNLTNYAPNKDLINIDDDTILSSGTLNAARHSAGTACLAVDDVINNVAKRAFVATRPPGHHAEPNMAMGFCLLNNVFIATRHAQTAHTINKIAIIDFDVHHGNGTETMAKNHNNRADNPPILYISSHAHPLFPMTGDPKDNDDTLLNIQLPPDFDSDDFRFAYEDEVFPALKAFKPELLLLSAGFDAHINDPLANARLKTDDFQWLTKKLCGIADTFAQGRIISILEGGYNTATLKECVASHLNALNT